MKDKALYHWGNQETPLAICCMAIDFAITRFEEVTVKGHRQFVAMGTITGKDYIEGGIEFTNPWEAVSTPGKPWEINRPKDGTEFWIIETTGEIIFTANSEVNNAMKKFIAGKLNEYVETRAVIGNEPLTVEPEIYQGPRLAYNGPCVCGLLAVSTIATPFPWEKLTGGQFPNHCFACSCGTRWWRYNQENQVWVKVVDPAAWGLLLKHNGEATRSMGFLKEGLYLTQTIRDHGLIPIG